MEYLCSYQRQEVFHQEVSSHKPLMWRFLSTSELLQLEASTWFWYKVYSVSIYIQVQGESMCPQGMANLLLLITDFYPVKIRDD